MSSTQTKEKIVQAMFKLIAEQGYEKASIGKIAEKVGIKKASVYYYYRKKEEILYEIIDNYINITQFGSEYCEINSDVEYKEYLHDYGINLIEEYTENLDFRKLYAEINLLSSRNEVVQEKKLVAVNSYRDMFENFFEHGKSIKALPEDFNVHNNAQLIILLFAGIDGIIISGMQFDIKSAWTEFVNKLL